MREDRRSRHACGECIGEGQKYENLFHDGFPDRGQGSCAVRPTQRRTPTFLSVPSDSHGFRISSGSLAILLAILLASSFVTGWREVARGHVRAFESAVL